MQEAEKLSNDDKMANFVPNPPQVKYNFYSYNLIFSDTPFLHDVIERV